MPSESSVRTRGYRWELILAGTVTFMVGTGLLYFGGTMTFLIPGNSAPNPAGSDRLLLLWFARGNLAILYGGCTHLSSDSLAPPRDGKATIQFGMATRMPNLINP